MILFGIAFTCIIASCNTQKINDITCRYKKMNGVSATVLS